MTENQTESGHHLRWLIPLFCLMLLIGVVAMRGQSQPVDDQGSENIVGVQTITATMVDAFRAKRTYTGVLKARRASELGFERTGRVEKILFDEGDVVEANQELASLDTENLNAKIKEVEAQRNAAQARLDELVAGPRQETIAAAIANVDDLQAQLSLANANFARVENLQNSSSISRQEYDAAKFALASVRGRLESARSNLSELKTGTRKEQLAAQRASVAQLDAMINSLQVEIRKSTLKAPFRARIATRNADEGSIVSPGVAVMRVVEDDVLEAWIGLPAGTVASLHKQEKFELAAAHKKVKAAKLKTVLPELDPLTRTQTAIFHIPSGSGLVPGQVIRIEVPEALPIQGFRLPTKALTRGQRGLWSVYVIKEEKNRQIAMRRDVEILHTDSEFVLVRGTITEGEQIISDGTHRITSGQIVHIVDPSAGNQ